MKFEHIKRESVLAAIQEFDCIKPAGMIDKYGGGLSDKLYIHFKEQFYDQKLIARAAHIHATVPDAWKCTPDEARKLLEEFKFTSNRSERHLKKLKFKIMDIKLGTYR